MDPEKHSILWPLKQKNFNIILGELLEIRGEQKKVVHKAFPKTKENFNNY